MENSVFLNKLALNKTAAVEEINCAEPLCGRLNDFGIISGETITPIFKSPFGDPTAYLVKNAVIALRDSDAGKIKVKPNE